MKKQVRNRLAVFTVLFLLFSCSKDLETPPQAPTGRSEKPTTSFYTQTTSIDPNVLLTLKQDTLFQEYVCFLDYTKEPSTNNSYNYYSLFSAYFSYSFLSVATTTSFERTQKIISKITS